MVTITKEGIKVLIQDINDKIKDLQKQKNELQEILKEKCEFSIGERVIVILFNYLDKEKGRAFGYIEKINVDHDGNFEYVILKEKKDLTPSAMAFSRYDRFTIEKIK